MDSFPTLEDILESLRRRAGLILSVMCLGFVLSAALGFAQDPVFESREEIVLAPPRLDERAVQAADRGRLAHQLPVLIRAVLSPGPMAEIATAYDLFAERPGLTPEARAAALQSAVRIEIGHGGEDDTPSRVTIAVRLGDPESAMLVAQELGHRLVRESVLLRIAEAQATLDFLTAREQALSADVADQDRRLTAFRVRHDADLAAGDPSTLDALAQIDAEIHAVDRARGALGTDPGAKGATLDRRRIALKAEKRARLRDLAPPAALEQDYAALLRGMDALLARRDEAALHRRAAEIALLLETRRMSERLTVAEPAGLPAEPLTDRRMAIAFGGGMFSALLAFALALFLDWRRPIVRSVAQLRRLTNADTVVVVPRARTRPGRPAAGRRIPF